MATVGEQLRAAREACHLGIPQVAERTMMRADHVRALEEGRYDAFIAPVYIRGFVRSYARLVKADEAAVLATLDEELGRTEKFREHPSLLGEQRTPLDTVMLQLSRIHWRIVLPVLGVLVIVGLAVVITRAVQNRQAHDPLEGIEPAQYQPARTNGGETLPLPAPAPARRTPGA